MLIWGILCLVFLAIGLTRVGVTAGYLGGTAHFALRIGPFTLRVPLSPGEKTAKPAKEKTKDETAKGAKEKKNLLASFHTGKLLQAGLRAVSRFGRHVRVDSLYFSFTAGQGDAAQTAIQYGSVCCAVSILLPLLRQGKKLRKDRVLVTMDYALPSPRVEGSITVTIRIGAILGIGVLFFIDLWRSRVT